MTPVCRKTVRPYHLQRRRHYLKRFRKKAFVYPFTHEILPIVRDRDRLPLPFDIVELVSPKSLGYEDVDAGELDGQGEVGLDIHRDFHRAIEQCGAVWFVEGPFSEKIRQDLIYKANEALAEELDVYYASPLENRQREILEENARFFGVKFSYCCYADQTAMEDTISKMTKEHYSPHTPILYISEATPTLCCCEVFFSLVERYKQYGYKVCGIMDRPYAEMIGFHTFPRYLFSEERGSTALVKYNNMIRHWEREETPDLFIIQMPPTLDRDFVELNYKLSKSAVFARSLSADFTVLCLPSNIDFSEHLNLLCYFYERQQYCSLDSVILDEAESDIDIYPRMLEVLQLHEKPAFLNKKVYESPSVYRLSGGKITEELYEQSKERLLYNGQFCKLKTINKR